jgi:hypothetical protein
LQCASLAALRVHVLGGMYPSSTLAAVQSFSFDVDAVEIGYAAHICDIEVHVRHSVVAALATSSD